MQENSDTHEYIILHYMQITGEEDYAIASTIVSEHNYNLQNAIDNRYVYTSNNVQQDEHYEYYHGNDEAIVMKYVNYWRKKNENWSLVGFFVSGVCNCVKGVWKYLGRKILPMAVQDRLLRGRFEILYREKMVVNYREESLKVLLENTKYKSNLAVMVVISEERVEDSVLGVIGNSEYVNVLNRSFMVTGRIAGDQYLVIFKGVRRDGVRKNGPKFTVIVCRMNIFEEIIIMEKFEGVYGISRIDIYKLQRLAHDSRNLQKRDKNVIIKYTNFRGRRLYGDYYVEYDYYYYVNLIERKQKTNEILVQNSYYELMQKLAAYYRNRKAYYMKKYQYYANRLYYLIEYRKIRKFSIPDYPQYNDNVVRVNFRCPDGSSKIRAFQQDEKIDLLYQWVYLNEEIIFYDNVKRVFYLMYSYPLKPLYEFKDVTLKEVFESTQEKVVIRYL